MEPPVDQCRETQVEKEGQCHSECSAGDIELPDAVVESHRDKYQSHQGGIGREEPAGAVPFKKPSGHRQHKCGGDIHHRHVDAELADGDAE